AVERQHIPAARRRERYLAGFQIERARDQLALADTLQQVRHRIGIVERLEHDLQPASARQTEACRLLLADAVYDDLRLAAGEIVIANAIDQIVFDTAAGDRSRYLTIVADSEQSARGTRSGAPRLHHGGKHHAMPA